MNKILVSVFCVSLSFGVSSYAEEKPMSADEVKATFTGKTCDGYNENKGKPYKIYMAEDGSMLHKNKKKD